MADKEQIVANDYQQLIDARSEAEYNGDVMKNGAIRSGHIPGAVLCDYYEIFSSAELTMKSKEELKKLMKRKKLSARDKTIVYCHSGVRSAFVTFALTEIAGMDMVSNYDGSWIEWSSDESLPVEPELD